MDDWFASNGQNGMVTAVVGLLQDIELLGCRSLNNGSFGVIFDAGVDIRIVGGTYSGNSQAAAGTADGIHFDGVDTVSVIGAISKATAGFADSQRYGIFNGAGNSNVIISENQVQGNLTAGIGNAGASSPNTKILNNNGHVTLSTGQAVVTSSSTSVLVTHGLDGVPTLNDIQIGNLTPTGAASNSWISLPTATTFTINVNVAPGSNISFSFSCRITGN